MKEVDPNKTKRPIGWWTSANPFQNVAKVSTVLCGTGTYVSSVYDHVITESAYGVERRTAVMLR